MYFGCGNHAEANKSRRGKLEPDEDVREGNRPILIGQIRIGLIIMTHPGFEDLQ